VIVFSSFCVAVASLNDITEAIARVLDALWPLVVLTVIGVLLCTKAGRTLVAAVGRSTRRVKLGQFELELTEQTAKEVKSSLEEAFRSYRKDVKSQFDIASHVNNLEERRDEVAQKVLSDIARTPKIRKWRLDKRTGRGHPRIRCTVYAPDILFADALYCLLDYWPTGDKPAGAAFSSRYGIIGKCWRRKQSEAAPNVPDDDDALMRDWGMTQSEARGHDGGSFLAVLLRHEGAPVGVLYADGERGAFRQSDCRTVEQAEPTRRLAKSLAAVLQEVRQTRTELRVFER
jgi:Sec-independent protein translocase protein TatA